MNHVSKLNSNLNLNDGIKTLATLSSSYYAWCRKRANNVDVHIYCSFADSGTAYQDIGLTLPEGYRPAGTFFATAFDDHTSIVFTLRISADGKIQPYCKNTGPTRYMLLNVSFTV